MARPLSAPCPLPRPSRRRAATDAGAGASSSFETLVALAPPDEAEKTTTAMTTGTVEMTTFDDF